jgi:hypothetical protein
MTKVAMRQQWQAEREMLRRRLRQAGAWRPAAGAQLRDYRLRASPRIGITGFGPINTSIIALAWLTCSASVASALSGVIWWGEPRPPGGWMITARSPRGPSRSSIWWPL